MLLQEYFQLYLWLAQYFLWTVCHRSLHSSLNGEWVCGHMCAWMCGSMCAGGGAYMCACRRSGWDTECLTLTFLHSLSQDFSLNLEVAYLAKSTGQYAPTISASPALGFRVCGTLPGFFTWILGGSDSGAMLFGKHFAEWVISWGPTRGYFQWKETKFKVQFLCHISHRSVTP